MPTGRLPHPPRTFTEAFQRAVAEAGVPRIRLHDLRHTHATIALPAGVPVKIICERLGHSAPTVNVGAHRNRAGRPEEFRSAGR